MARPTLDEMLHAHQRLHQKGLTPQQAQAPHTAAAHAAVNMGAQMSGSGSSYGSTDPHEVSARQKQRSLRDKYGEGAQWRRIARQIWADKHGIDANVNSWDRHTVDLARRRGLLPGGHQGPNQENRRRATMAVLRRAARTSRWSSLAPRPRRSRPSRRSSRRWRPLRWVRRWASRRIGSST
jgi:hypothetical protein